MKIKIVTNKSNRNSNIDQHYGTYHRKTQPYLKTVIDVEEVGNSKSSTETEF